MHKTFTTTHFARYIADPETKESRAFFEGAREMMTALELLPENEHASVLAHKNQQHIISLLVQSAEIQRRRRRQDIENLLKICEFDKREALAFIFDAPQIDTETGIACDSNGLPLEDENFKPLSDKVNPGYPDYSIYYYTNVVESYPRIQIFREEYLKLSEEERLSCNYTRYLPLKIGGKVAQKIQSTDQYFMAVLIEKLIAIGYTGVNRRFVTEARGFNEETGEDCGPLWTYHDVIHNALEKHLL